MQSAANPNRRKMLLVMAVFALPILASYLAYFVWRPEGAKQNYGELIKVVTLPESLALGTVQGQPLSLKSLRGKWLLVQVDDAACDAACERKLYVMRQVQRAQGAEQDRVRRLWLVRDGARPRADLQKRYDGTEWLTDGPRAVIGQLQADGDVAHYIYLVDPLGNVMMRWSANPDMKRMHKDIERLLRASQIG